MKDKVISLTELNKISSLSHNDIKEFVHKKYGEGWYLESDLFTKTGSIKIFSDTKGVKYTIEFIRNSNGISEPLRVLRICNVIVDFKS